MFTVRFFLLSFWLKAYHVLEFQLTSVRIKSQWYKVMTIELALVKPQYMCEGYGSRFVCVCVRVCVCVCYCASGYISGLYVQTEPVYNFL